MMELEHICAGYDREETLHDINLSFAPGRLTVLLGPNGCGKSTLLKTAAGLLMPQSGRVLLDSRTLADLSPRERALQLAFLPQSRRVPALSVERFVLHGRFPHLGYPRRTRPADLEAVHAALETAGIGALAHKSMESISGGERQSAYIALALAQDTPMILLDEPTTYLDIGHQLAVFQLLCRLRDAGKTVVLVTHELDLGLRYADTVCLMEKGRLLQQAAPDTLDAALLGQIFGVQANRTEEGWRFALL